MLHHSTKPPKEDPAEERKPMQSENSEGYGLLQVKAPPFSQERPALWFAQLESQFRIRKIVTEVDKFHVAVPLIGTRSAAEVEDIITFPPTDSPYQKLKSTLISRFSKSKAAKLLQLLDGESLGDRKPSQHYRHLRSLVPDIDDDALRARWLSHLPEQIRACLVVQKEAASEQLCEAADSLCEILKPSNVAAVSEVQGQIAAMTTQVSQLAEMVKRGRTASRERSFNRPRSRARSQSREKRLHKSGTCWYHFKFGKDARKCVPGCKFQGNAAESR